MSRRTNAIDLALVRVGEACRVRRLRSIRAFAEQEVALPTGPYADLRFKVERNPWAGLWLAELDGGWRRFVLTGPSQAGKTLMGSALPVMYHLFEHRETVIYAAPTLEMANDKWRQDVLPLIERSRYRDLLPRSGAGSKGGTVSAIQFNHGPTLKFMTGGGSDKVRAGFTSRVVVITETDGMDESGGSSREADKVSQLEARTNAFGDRARVYMECTVSTEEGRTWRELKNGTDSRIAMPCPHCGEFVTPEREHLTGWQDAASVDDARDAAALCCPACGQLWSEAERGAANAGARLAHKGQTVEAGTLVGLAPRTQTLGFRFTAANNLLVGMPRVAEEEWTAPRTTDGDDADKKLRQFYWTMPSEPEAVTLSEMDAAAICARAIDVPRGRVPADATRITMGIDVGKWLCHWVAVAWRLDGTPHVIEYGRVEVPSQSMAEEVAILTALRRFRDEVCNAGWPMVGDRQDPMRPSLALVDARDWTTTVKTFTAESGAGFVASQGHSITRLAVKSKWPTDPGYDVEDNRKTLRETGVLPVNADLWKSFVHARLQTPAGQPGGLTLYHATAQEHLSFAKHMTAEKRVEEFVAGRGLVSRWEALSRNNHFLDATALACVAGHAVGQRIVTAHVAPPKPAAAPRPVADRDRQPTGGGWLGGRSNWLGNRKGWL